MMNTNGKPVFETFADATLNRVRATYAQRGTEYGDTWKNSQFLMLKAVAKQLGVEIPDTCLRAISAAVLCDVKYQRMEGGFKDDSLVDGIAYTALLAEEMKRIMDGDQEKVAVNGNGNGYGQHLEILRQRGLTNVYQRVETLAGRTQPPEPAPATPSV